MAVLKKRKPERNGENARVIVFPNGLKVKRGVYLNGGCQRRGYACNYKYKGRKYILKCAKYDSGVTSNKSEYDVYRFVKGTDFEKYFPDFRYITSNNRWLLVERCTLAQDQDYGDAGETDFFPAGILHDDHNENWGFTESDGRPVILDMAHTDYQYTSLKDTIKSQAKRIKKRKAKRKPKKAAKGR